VVLKKFLMTGKLHLPVPAVVIAGPIYRGGIFMPLLFLSTVLLVGPAWCSFLCYVGPVVGLLLRFLGVKGILPLIVGIGFGIFEIFVMIFISTRRGKMVNCVYVCPLGLVGNILGKISPFRIRINDNCNNCYICSRACKYDALLPQMILKRRPGYTCTLCGDCIDVCNVGAIRYSFLGLSAEKSRILFYLIVISLHAVFLGVARI